MTSQGDAFLRHQQARFLRPDAYRWVRPDAARFYKPGTKREEIFPALARKYNPNQPRVTAGDADGGQWTEEDGGTARPRLIIDTTNLGDGSDRDTTDEIGSLGLFGIKPRER